MGNVLNDVHCSGSPLGLEDGDGSIAGQYEMHMFPQRIGQGMFSKTYVCWRRGHTDDRYALKVYETDGFVTDAVDHASNEIEILRHLGRHPRIVDLVDTDQDESSTVRLVQELCEGGQLYDKLSEKGAYEDHEAAIVMQQLFEAVGFMHDKGIMHRDLKPENVLLVSTDSDVDIKLCDFGISKRKEGPEKLPRSMSFTGSAYYVAPEMIQQKEYSVEVDIWALGVIAFALMTGSLPFVTEDHEDMLAVYRKIVDLDYDFEHDNWSDSSEASMEFIRRCLTERKERPTASQALADIWIRRTTRTRQAKTTLQRAPVCCPVNQRSKGASFAGA